MSTFAPGRPAQTKSAAKPALTPMRPGLLQRKCACGAPTPAGGECAECKKKKNSLQRKLAIGASNDPLEQEADRVAEQALTAPGFPTVSGTVPHIQRYTGQPTGQTHPAPPSVDRVLASPGRPLETALRQDMEHRLGHEFSQVRVHADADAEQSAREVNAHAYTVGHSIVFGAGQFAPGTAAGRRLIAHELAHVVQQGEGRPALQRKKSSGDEFEPCGPLPMGSLGVVGGPYLNQGIALPYDKIVPLSDPMEDFDREESRTTFTDPSRLEQVYYDASNPNFSDRVRAAWWICNVVEPTAREIGFENARDLHKIGCLTVLNCSVNWDVVFEHFSAGTASGRRIRGIILKGFSDKGFELDLDLRLINSALLLLDGLSVAHSGMGVKGPREVPTEPSQPAKSTEPPKQTEPPKETEPTKPVESTGPPKQAVPKQEPPQQKRTDDDPKTRPADSAAKQNHEQQVAAKQKHEQEAAATRKREQEAAAKKKQEQEAAAKQKREQEAAAKKKHEQEAAAKQKQEQEAAAKQKHAQEAAAKQKHEQEAAAKQKHEQEAAAKQKREQEAAAKQKQEQEAAEEKLDEKVEAERKRQVQKRLDEINKQIAANDAKLKKINQEIKAAERERDSRFKEYSESPQGGDVDARSRALKQKRADARKKMVSAQQAVDGLEAKRRAVVGDNNALHAEARALRAPKIGPRPGDPHGGAHKDVYKPGMGGEVHHIPPDSVSPLSHGDGPAVWMERPDHLRTNSHGSGKTAQQWRARQKALIDKGQFRDAVDMDVQDIRDKFGNKYDQGIKEMLDYVDKIYPKVPK